MNKSELVDVVAEKIGAGRGAAASAVDAVLDSIVAAVAKGEKVGLVGFGTFDKRARNARTARNIRTGAIIKVKATSVPGFKAGQAFKEAVAGGKKAAPAAKKPAKKVAAKKAPAKKAAAKKAPAKKAAKKK